MLIVSKCDTINAALFYLCKVVEGNMSRTFTFRQLTSCLEVREIRKSVRRLRRSSSIFITPNGP